jgi:photosynthetic reaction center cytochrome c subunit
MRSFLCVTAAAFLFAFPTFAQAPAGNAGPAGRGPRNLKILAPENFRSSMDVFTQALGVQCTYCHVQGAFDSDDKPQKNTARMMLTMTREINERFGDGKLHVRCYTCHRASAQPLTEPPGRTEPPAR